MKFKHLIFGLLTVGSMASFAGCNDSTPEPVKECVTCENETIVDSLVEQDAIIRLYSPNESSSEYDLYIIDTQKRYMNEEYTAYSQDSIFVPCPPITDSSLEGKKIKISGNITSCDSLLTHPNVWVVFGRKLNVLSLTQK